MASYEELLGRFAMLAYDKIPDLTVRELVENFTPEYSALKQLPAEQAWKLLEKMVDEKVREREKPPKVEVKPPEKREHVEKEEKEEKKKRFLDLWFSMLKS